MSQHQSNARHIMARRMYVLKTHTPHNREQQQMNQMIKQLFNVSTIHSNYSFQSLTPLINRLVYDLLVKILSGILRMVYGRFADRRFADKLFDPD